MFIGWRFVFFLESMVTVDHILPLGQLNFLYEKSFLTSVLAVDFFVFHILDMWIFFHFFPYFCPVEHVFFVCEGVRKWPNHSLQSTFKSINRRVVTFFDSIRYGWLHPVPQNADYIQNVHSHRSQW